MSMIFDFIPAGRLDDAALDAQLQRVNDVISEGFEDHGGSPGEFWYERRDELYFEKQKRDI
ncbi:hypothetical protein [Roseibium sp.]|uniref:hypothetical protein n=1 Tax=Roseibium sp. TaxID=1936156 RepID=UPI003B52D49B